MPRHTSATSSVNDPGKGESRSTPAYQTGGSLFLPAILIPLTSSGSACPSVVAGAIPRFAATPVDARVRRHPTDRRHRSGRDTPRRRGKS